MTVLQVCAYGATYAGNFIASLEALEAELAKRNIRTIYAFVGRAGEQEWCKKIEQRTKVYYLPEAKARILPKTYEAFRRIYKENDISIVHSHFELYDIPATVMAKPGTKIFWHLHDAIGEGYSKSGTLHRILTRIQYGIVGKKATLLSVSRKHGEFAQSLGFPANQIIFTPNGINLQRIKPVKLDVNYKKFLMLGWDILRKGVDIVVDTARISAEDLQFVVVGYQDCKEYLEQNNAPGNIVFQEPVKDINALYKDARAFLHVSRAEGLSYALLEVIYAGLPVICSDIPENQFATAFANVEMVPVGDYKALSVAICRTLECSHVPTDSEQNYNRRLIEEQYSIKAWCKTICNHYGASV